MARDKLWCAFFHLKHHDLWVSGPFLHKDCKKCGRKWAKYDPSLVIMNEKFINVTDAINDAVILSVKRRWFDYYKIVIAIEGMTKSLLVKRNELCPKPRVGDKVTLVDRIDIKRPTLEHLLITMKNISPRFLYIDFDRFELSPNCSIAWCKSKFTREEICGVTMDGYSFVICDDVTLTLMLIETGAKPVYVKYVGYYNDYSGAGEG